MPHYSFTLVYPDGKQKPSTNTGKTAADASALAIAHHPGCKVVDIKKVVTQKQTVASKPADLPHPTVAAQKKKALPEVAIEVTQPKSKSTPRVTMAALDRLYFLEHGRCFYCGKCIRREDASVDHIVPKSKGGTNDESNLALSCKRLNMLFGDYSLKEKIRFLLLAKNGVQCPDGDFYDKEAVYSIIAEPDDEPTPTPAAAADAPVMPAAGQPSRQE